MLHAEVDERHARVQRALAERPRRVEALNHFALATLTTTSEPDILFLAIDMLAVLFPVTGAVGVLNAEGGLKVVVVRSREGTSMVLEPEGEELCAAIAATLGSQDVSVIQEPALPEQGSIPLARWLDRFHPGLVSASPSVRRSLLAFGLSSGLGGAPDLLVCRSETDTAGEQVASVADLSFLRLACKHLNAALITARARHDLERQVESRTHELSEANSELASRLSELRSTQTKLIDASRKAGRADVAASVLHNVGNVLNSVNVSAELLLRLVRSSKGTLLDKALSLWRSQPDPVHFLTEDSRGQKLVDYLLALSGALGEERAEALNELAHLARNIEHIKAIVGAHQSLARVAGVVEELSLDALIDDAIQTSASSHAKHRITIERDYATQPSVKVDRHRLLQILINLLSNAEHAVKQCASERRITLRTRLIDHDHVAIDVEDNGIGIAPENLSKLFIHGFTTKPDGHGFGLHSSACAAEEIGGRLTVHSDGPGMGAVFTVLFPRAPAV
jgi:signal transduction histidine kinase